MEYLTLVLALSTRSLHKPFFTVSLPKTSRATQTLTNHRLEAILANRLVLNLRSIGTLEGASELSSTKVDIYFRRAYGVDMSANQTSPFVNVVLGNVGEPIRVEDDDKDADERSEEEDEVMEDIV